jgi:hypothetical protein
MPVSGTLALASLPDPGRAASSSAARSSHRRHTTWGMQGDGSRLDGLRTVDPLGIARHGHRPPGADGRGVPGAGLRPCAGWRRSHRVGRADPRRHRPRHGHAPAAGRCRHRQRHADRQRVDLRARALRRGTAEGGLPARPAPGAGLGYGASVVRLRRRVDQRPRAGADHLGPGSHDLGDEPGAGRGALVVRARARPRRDGQLHAARPGGHLGHPARGLFQGDQSSFFDVAHWVGSGPSDLRSASPRQPTAPPSISTAPPRSPPARSPRPPGRARSRPSRRRARHRRCGRPRRSPRRWAASSARCSWP